MRPRSCSTTSAQDGLLAGYDRRGSREASSMAPVHVNGVRDYLVDIASPEDFEALDG